MIVLQCCCNAALPLGVRGEAGGIETQLLGERERRIQNEVHVGTHKQAAHTYIHVLTYACTYLCMHVCMLGLCNDSIEAGFTYKQAEQNMVSTCKLFGHFFISVGLELIGAFVDLNVFCLIFWSAILEKCTEIASDQLLFWL